MEVGTLRSTKDGLCAMCYAKASVKCSRCKQCWYCSSECQEKDWKLGHKGDCGLADLKFEAVPTPPATLLPESVDRPVLSEAAWRRLVEATELGPRPGPPRGLRNIGNSCYMNAVLQSLHHAAPLLLAASREHHVGRGTNGPSGERCRCSPEGGCFRSDLEATASTCLEPRPPPAAAASAEGFAALAFTTGDQVALCGLGKEELNGKVGVVVDTSGAGTGGEARCEVRLAGTPGTKAVRPQNLQLRCRAPVGPRELARWLPRLGAEFTFGMQEDAHEFLRSVLRLVEDEELREHAEALRRRGEEQQGAASGGAQGAAAPPPLPAPNADLTASPSRIFGGLLVSQITCTNRECGRSSFSFESFMDLSLDITEATDSVEDALRLFTSAERLDKQNGWRCEVCSETVRARKQITIYNPPGTLVLQLKRFRYGERGKVTRPVAFSPELNLRPFLCANAQGAGRPLLYELRAIIVHLDKAGYSTFGHYVAYVRCADGAKGASRWHLLDDSQATEIPEAEVLKQQAYLLIYSAAAAPSALAARKALGGGAADAAAAAPAETAPLPSKCHGRRGAVCSFFACSDGLCTRCYQEEHGRPPPAASSPAEAEKPAPALAGGIVGAGVGKARKGGAAASGSSPAGKPAAAASGGGGKAKKMGPNDQCPCGSGKKYKKCHGSAGGA